MYEVVSGMFRGCCFCMYVCVETICLWLPNLSHIHIPTNIACIHTKTHICIHMCVCIYIHTHIYRHKQFWIPKFKLHTQTWQIQLCIHRREHDCQRLAGGEPLVLVISWENHITRHPAQRSHTVPAQGLSLVIIQWCLASLFIISLVGPGVWGSVHGTTV